MSAIAGRGGSVVQGANVLTFVESWELSISDETLETTGLGATGKTFIGRGLPENSGTINWRALDNSGTGEAALRAAAQANGTSVTLNLYESGTKYWACTTCYVKSFSQQVGVDGLVSGSLGFVVSGNPTYT